MLFNEHLGVFMFHFLVKVESQKKKEGVWKRAELKCLYSLLH